MNVVYTDHVPQKDEITWEKIPDNTFFSAYGNLVPYRRTYLKINSNILIQLEHNLVYSSKDYRPVEWVFTKYQELDATLHVSVKKC